MKNIIKRIIVGFGIALCMWFFRSYIVSAKVYDENLTIPNFLTVRGPSYYSKNTTLGTYFYALESDIEINQSQTWFIEFSFNHSVKDDGKWIYITGYSNFAMNAASLNGACEIVSGSMNNNIYYTGIQNGSQAFTSAVQTLMPFTIKCGYQTVMTQYVDLYGTYSSISSSATTTFKPYVYIRPRAYIVSDDTTSDSILIQQLQEEQQQTDVQNEIKDFLKDTSTPNNSDYNFSDYNEDNGVITNLLTMPITLTQGILNGLNNGCSSYNFGSIKGQNISFPCINPGQHLGLAWNIIDIILSGVFIFIFGKKCITIFNDVTNLRSNQVDEVFK